MAYALDRPSSERIARALARGDAGCACGTTAARGHGLTHCVGPNHRRGDQHPSLSVAEGDTADVVLFCHAGCPPDAVIAALQDQDLWPRNDERVVAFPQGRADGRRKNLVGKTVYEFPEAGGVRHVREDYADGRKSYYWQQADGRLGLPAGVKVADLLYGAELLDGLPDGATIVTCEGEKATHAARAAGLVAVGTATGASGTLSDDVLRRLDRFDVVLWADHDEQGFGHMGRHAEGLRDLGACPRWVRWADAPPKGDAADAPADEVARLVHDAPAYAPDFLAAETSTLIAAETNALFVTARDFAASTPAEPDWIAKPYVARGAITEVAGKLKASGKTTWLLSLCRKVLDGEPFMGCPTTRSGIIYLTEQAGTSFRAALARADLLERDDFAILFWNRARGLAWPAVVRAAVDQATRRGYGLVVVDTLSQFSGVTGDNENSAGAALDAMKPLQEATAADLAVVVSRHERKGGGEVGESGRGSSAYSGAVDVVLSIRRGEGQSSETIRVIQSLSRFDETPGELVIDLVDGEYLALGSAQDVKARQALSVVLDMLPTSEAEALDTKAICEALSDAKIGRTTLQDALAKHLESGRVRRVGTGKKGDPFKYWHPETMLSAAAPVVSAESIEPVGDDEMTERASPDDDGLCPACRRDLASDELPCPACVEVTT